MRHRDDKWRYIVWLKSIIWLLLMLGRLVMWFLSDIVDGG